MGQAGCDSQMQSVVVRCGGSVGTAVPIGTMLGEYVDHF